MISSASRMTSTPSGKRISSNRAEAVGTQPYAEYLHFHKKGDVIL